MSRAVELAKKCGFPDWWLNPPEPERQNGNAKRMIEAFYHAARAEALREAAERMAQVRTEPRGAMSAWASGYETAMADCGDALRAMADREGK